MAGRPRKTAKLLNQLINDFLPLERRLDALCPTAYQKRPPNHWSRHYKMPWPEWEKKYGAFYDANAFWFLWYEVSDSASQLFWALMELREALEERAGLTTTQAKESPLQ